VKLAERLPVEMIEHAHRSIGPGRGRYRVRRKYEWIFTSAAVGIGVGSISRVEGRALPLLALVVVAAMVVALAQQTLP
jgi:hypothetical protein